MKKTLSAVAILGIVAGCGGGSDSGSAGPGAGSGTGSLVTLTGQLVDSSVVNVGYSTSSGLLGMTDADGKFDYRAGDTVKFSIGKIVLGEGRGAAIVTPIDLVAGAVALDHPEVVKILQVLQTLDDDGDAANGIRIPAAVTERLAALPSEKKLKDVSDLTTGVISLAFAGIAPVLKTPAAATLHFAETLGFLEATQQMGRMPAVSNFVIGGGNKNCSSFNGDLKSANCAADWTTIVAQDPAFSGLTKANLSFDASYPFPTFTYSIAQAGIDRLNALPASLFDSSRKAAVLAALTTRLASAAPKTGLSFSDFDGSKALFADGAAFWNGSTLNDFNLLLTVMCGSASPANGADCTISAANIATLQAATFDTAADKDKVVLILRNLQAAYGATIKYRRDAAGLTVTPNFRAEFQARQLAADGSPVAAGLTATLTPPEKAVVRSVFVDPNPQTSRKFEARTVKFLTDKATYDITTQFVKAASALNGGKKPVIGVVTASAGNTFLDRDINVFALKSAGADVVYLPFDGGFRKALDANDCANTRYYYDSYANTNALGDIHHMDQVYPDLAKEQQDFCASGGAALNAALSTLHGIYFSGGDQARHLESFITRDAAGAYTVVSEQARILQTRFAAGQLVVSGTSAGNHIQGGGLWRGKPVPMIGGGDSYPALKKGFAEGAGPVLDAPQNTINYARGGLGFFNYGVLDSHFSRRTREGRLIRATKESGMDYGFGIDENTSLVVGRPGANGKTAFAVIGAAGVFIADVRGAAATGTAGGNYSIDGVKAHYLTAGDLAEIDTSGNLTVTLAASKPLLPSLASQPAVAQDKIQDYGSSNFLNLAKAVGVSGAPAGFGTTQNSADGSGDPQNAPLYAVTLTRGPATVFRGFGAGRVSYSNLGLKMAPCDASCVAP
jgi:cyanophycinase